MCRFVTFLLYGRVIITHVPSLYEGWTLIWTKGVSNLVPRTSFLAFPAQVKKRKENRNEVKVPQGNFVFSLKKSMDSVYTYPYEGV